MKKRTVLLAVLVAVTQVSYVFAKEDNHNPTVVRIESTPSPTPAHTPTPPPSPTPPREDNKLPEPTHAIQQGTPSPPGPTVSPKPTSNPNEKHETKDGEPGKEPKWIRIAPTAAPTPKPAEKEIRERTEKIKQEGKAATDKEAEKILAGELKDKVENGKANENDANILATLELMDGKNEEAKAHIEKLLADKPEAENLYKTLSDVYKAKGDTEKVKVYVNGKQPDFDVQPYIKEGRTMIPLRAVSEALDAKVEWDDKMRTVIISKDSTVIRLPLGSNTIMVNDTPVDIDVPAELSGDRTMIPVRFVSEYLNKKVEFDQDTKLVVVR